MNNSIKTWVYLAALSALALTVGGFAAGRQGLVLGFIFAFLMTVICWVWSNDWLLWTFHGRLLEGIDPYGIRKTVHELCQIAGIPEPKIYLIPTPTPNIFSIGRTVSGAGIVISEGAIQVLSKTELKAVLAHEISHIMNSETFLMTVVSSLTSVIYYAVEGFKWVAALGSAERAKTNSVGLLIEKAAYPFAAVLVRVPLRRRREFEADKQAVELTRDPNALAHAIWKIHHHGRALPMSAPAHTAHLFIVNPLKDQKRLFETHPPVQERIRKLIGRTL
jgi:heat shock protein HtpX